MHKIHILVDELLVVSLLCNVVGMTYLRHTCGTLKIDRSNPAKDLYRFDIDNLDALSNKKRIVLKVDNKADLSHD